MQSKQLLIFSIIALSILLSSCTQTVEIEKEIDLCDQISVPSATVYCEGENGCTVVISGDSRVKYLVKNVGVWGAKSIGYIKAGEEVDLDSNTQEYISVEPRDGGKPCDSKSIKSYREDFKGDVQDIPDSLYEMYGK
ncbi:hypothetical protein HOC01_03850 [archaeon]|jgi:hypothetical protein|nr:hypothetical protein [archaeon]MBT6698453.1 hypothetical protein [archaeon]